MHSTFVKKRGIRNDSMKMGDLTFSIKWNTSAYSSDPDPLATAIFHDAFPKLKPFNCSLRRCSRVIIKKQKHDRAAHRCFSHFDSLAEFREHSLRN